MRFSTVRQIVVAALLGGCLASCHSYAAYVYSALDPSYSPARSDPVWVTLSVKPTIRERQLVVVLKEELVRNGFVLADSEARAKWVLALSAERRTYDFGVTATTMAIPVSPTLALATTRSTRNTVEQSTIFLYLFDANDFRAGKILSVWEGSASATENVYRIYITAMLKILLDVYGTNYERNTRLSKDYVNARRAEAAARAASQDTQR